MMTWDFNSEMDGIVAAAFVFIFTLGFLGTALFMLLVFWTLIKRKDRK